MDTTVRSKNMFKEELGMLIRKFETRLEQISKNYSNVEHTLMYECQFLDMLNDKSTGVGRYYDGPKDKYFDYHLKVRGCMRGGDISRKRMSPYFNYDFIRSCGFILSEFIRQC